MKTKIKCTIFITSTWTEIYNQSSSCYKWVYESGCKV